MFNNDCKIKYFFFVCFNAIFLKSKEHTKNITYVTLRTY